MSPTYALTLGAAEEARYAWMAENARHTEAGAWRAAGVRSGAAVADLGCGPGAILVELAAAVGPGGRVDGIDADPVAVAAARDAITRAGISHAGVLAGDVAATGLEHGRYDVVMLRHVLGHVGTRGTPAVLRHAVELLSPGGHVLAVDSDLAAVRRVPADPDLDDEADRYGRFLAARGGDGRAGPGLARSLLTSGLEVVDFTGRYDILWCERLPALGPARAARAAMLADGIAGPADARRWDEAGARYLAHPRGKYVLIPTFLAVGRRAA